MGVTSLGHRLTILKGVYDIKIKQSVPIELDHYVPLCMFRTSGLVVVIELILPRSGRCKRTRRARFAG